MVFPEVSICILSRTEEILSHPAGLLVWTAIHAHWRLLCQVKQDPQLTPVPLNRFLHAWCTSLSDWADPPNCSLRLPLIRGFQRGIDSFIRDGRFTFSPSEALSSPQKKKSHSSAIAGLKPNLRTLLDEAVKNILQFTSKGWRIVFTHGLVSFLGSRRSFQHPSPLRSHKQITEPNCGRWLVPYKLSPRDRTHFAGLSPRTHPTLSMG